MRRNRPESRLRPAIGRTTLAVLLVVGVGAASCGAATAVPEQDRAAAKLETFRLPSRLVDPDTPGGTLLGDRQVPEVHVLLPAGYREHREREYPVLWLLHGAGESADRWIPGIEQLAAGLPAVVVMPDGGRFGMYADWWNDGARGDPAWATYHLEVLRRRIEHRYRIRPGRRWHAIAGISMGGQGALRYAAMRPGYFGSVAALSAAFPDTQAPVAEGGLTAFAAANGAEGAGYESIFGPVDGAYATGNNPQALVPDYGHTRMYLTSGDGTSCPQDPPTRNPTLDGATEAALHAQQAPFADLARASGADVTAVTTCGVHTNGVWNRAFAAVRSWGLFDAVPQRPEHWVYRTVATAGDAWGLHFRFGHPPATVAELTRAGRTLTATGAGRVVITGPHGCRLTLRLPTEQVLPAACRRAG